MKCFIFYGVCAMISYSLQREKLLARLLECSRHLPKSYFFSLYEKFHDKSDEEIQRAIDISKKSI